MIGRLFIRMKAAFRSNRVPGIVIWIFGMAMIGGYYWFEPLQEAMNRIAALKTRFGFLFSAVSMGFFAGFIPALVSMVMGRIPRHRRLRDTVFLTLLWAYKGMEIDLLYRLQAVWFGEGSDPATLVRKMVVDQFLYMPLIGMVPLLILYQWKDTGYRWNRTGACLKTSDFWEQFPLVVVSCWSVWIPAVMMIYWFPSSLQITIGVLIECFWALVLIVLTGSKGDVSELESAEFRATG